MEIKTSTATVYHGGGRRWLTKKSAKRAEVWSILKQHCCDCEDADVPSSDGSLGYPGNVCTLHKLRADFKAMAIDKVLEFYESAPNPWNHDFFLDFIDDTVCRLLGDQKEEDERLTVAGVGYTTKL